MRAAHLQVSHMHIDRIKPGLGEGVSHFHMRVHTLLAQDGDLGAAQIEERRGHILGGVEAQRHLQAWVFDQAGGRVLGIGTGRVVALLIDLPAHAVPDLVQIEQLGAENGLGIAPNLQLALACVDRGRQGPGLANEMAVFGQAVLAQRLHHRVALDGCHLNYHAQLFAEQGLQRELLAPRADLLAPVLGVTVLGAAV